MSVKSDIKRLLEFEKTQNFYVDVCINSGLEALDGSYLFTIYQDLDDEHIAFGKEMLKDGILRMPFEKTLIQTIQSDGHKAVCLVWQDQNDLRHLAGLVFAQTDKSKEWFIPVQCYFPGKDYPSEWRMAALQSPLGSIGLTPILDPEMREYGEERAKDWGGYWSMVVLSTASILLSKDASVDVVKPDQRKNARRIASGKEAIEEYRVVRLSGVSAKRSSSEAGDRKSPRMHWRRGHIRRKGEKLIPVAPTIVGASGKLLPKSYIFKN